MEPNLSVGVRQPKSPLSGICTPHELLGLQQSPSEYSSSWRSSSDTGVGVMDVHEGGAADGSVGVAPLAIRKER